MYERFSLHIDKKKYSRKEKLKRRAANEQTNSLFKNMKNCLKIWKDTDNLLTSILHFNICGFKLHIVRLNGSNQIINSQRSMPCSILEQSLNIQNDKDRKMWWIGNCWVLVHSHGSTYFRMAVSKSTSTVWLSNKLQLADLHLSIHKCHTFISYSKAEKIPC